MKFYSLVILGIAMQLLSGCIGNDSKQGTLPPILLNPNIQSKIIIIQGLESGLKWESITYEISGDDPTCEIKAPTKGEIQPGQAIHIFNDDTNGQCIITVMYEKILIASYTFKPTNPIDPKEPPPTDQNKTE